MKQLCIALLIYLVSSSANAFPGRNCYEELDCHVIERPCNITSKVMNAIHASYVWRDYYHFICQDRSGQVYQTESFLSSPYTRTFRAANVFDAMETCENSIELLVLCSAIKEKQ